MALQTAVSLKPTLLLALCPESSFPISHPATWTKLRHAERTSIFTQRAAPPTAAWAQTPFRTPVTDRGLLHPLSCEGNKPPGGSVAARRSSEEPRYDLHSEARSVTASLPVRCPVIHITMCFEYSMCLLLLTGCFLVLICWLLEKHGGWFTECAVSGVKSPAAMWELLSFAWTQSPFSWIYNSPHQSTQQFAAGCDVRSC